MGPEYGHPGHGKMAIIFFSDCVINATACKRTVNNEQEMNVSERALFIGELGCRLGNGEFSRKNISQSIYRIAQIFAIL